MREKAGHLTVTSHRDKRRFLSRSLATRDTSFALLLPCKQRVTECYAEERCVSLQPKSRHALHVW